MKNKKILVNIILTLLILLAIVLIHWQLGSNNIINLKVSTYIGVMVNLFCIISTITIEKKLNALVDNTLYLIVSV